MFVKHRKKVHPVLRKAGSSKKYNLKKILLWIGLTISGLSLLGLLTVVITVAVVSVGLPDVRDLDKLSLSESTTIYDREGGVLYVKHGGENRQYVTLSQMSPHVINGTVDVEDDQYWNHHGFDPVAIIRAVVSTATGDTQGGSTITQQYIKNTFLSSEQTLSRKIKELILAVQLEQTYDKEKILELYLNKIAYGNNAYGVEKAAQVYFSKHVKDLSLAESAIIASIPKSPTYYDPYGENLYSRLTKQFTPEELERRKITKESDLKMYDEYARGLIGKTIRIDDTHIVYLKGRSDVVLDAMVFFKHITPEEREQALQELQNMKFEKKYNDSIKAPHFVMYVLKQLEDKYGKELVEQGGLKVYTTIDPRLQEIGERVVAEGAEKNEKNFNAKNASLVAIDPKTGEILTLVGSRNYFDTEIDGAVNVANQYRQPGSSFKPFVYAQAFLKGYAPANIVFDVQTRFGQAYPKNFDGKFWGPMTVRKALGQSRNIPAIKLFQLGGGQEPVLQLAEKMGIHFHPDERKSDLGWPLSLGSAGVKLIDLTSAFSVFANGGIRHEPVSIIRVQNAKGETLEEWKLGEGTEAIDPEVAYLINSVLSDTSVRLSENLTIPGHTNGAKTGTSDRQDAKGRYYPHDLWAMGYTTKLAAGVWTGNNRDDEGNIGAGADGSTIAAPIWKKFMTEALKGTPQENFPRPSGIKEVTVSTISGKLAGPNTPPDKQVQEIFASFAVPTETDDSLSEVEIDTRNKKLSNQFCPPLFTQKIFFQNVSDIGDNPEWQKGADAWLSQHSGEITGNVLVGVPPTEVSELCTQENYNNKPEINILEPNASDTVEIGSILEVKIKVKPGAAAIEKVEFYFDGELKYFTPDAPYIGRIRLPKGEVGTNQHTLSVKVFDKLGYSSENEIKIFTGSIPSES